MVKIIIIACSLLALLPAGVSAQSFQASNIYLSASLDLQSLEVDGSSEDLESLVAAGSVGYWVREGIGLELDLGTGVSNDSVGDLDVDFRSQFGLSLRFESPPTGRIAAYALFGFVRTSYRAETDGVSSDISLPGGRVALGLTFLLRPQLVLDGAFTHHDLDDNTRVNSFRFGVRYGFGS